MAKTVEKLLEIVDLPNIADKFSEDQTADLLSRVFNGYEADQLSCKDWQDAAEEGFKLVDQILEEKNYPWEGAANVKYPLITVAAMQFAARAYPNIVNGTQIVKTKTNTDPNDQQMIARADAVAKHLNWQLSEEIENWDAETDAMLHALPIVGTYFRKTYYCKAAGQIESIIVDPRKVIVNNDARSLEKAPRVSHQLELSKNDVIERERSGDFELVSDKMQSTNDQDTEEFIEQHCWFDWDKDGYEEPYIVTVHSTTRTLCRVVPRFKQIHSNEKGEVVKITPHDYWTKYSFIPNPKGKVYDLGFAHLIGPLNHSVNTVFNQLLDAGSLSNLQAGFLAKTARGVSGNMMFKPGEWKYLDTMGQPLKDAIFPLPVRDPSQVLFQLLGLMNEMATKISSVTDVMTGESPGQNVPATTSLAMIEQGLKVFTSIYKRIHRAMKAELAKIYLLNSMFLDKAKLFTLDGEQSKVTPDDYNLGDMTVVPVVDPSQASQTQALAKAQALLQVLQINPTNGGKLFTLTKYYEAVGMQPDEIKQLLPQEQAPPSPDALKLQLEAQKSKDDMEIRRMELEQSLYKLEAEIEVLRTQAIKNIADAESKEAGQQMQQYEMQLGALDQKYGQLADSTRQQIEFIKMQSEAAKNQPQAPQEPKGPPPPHQISINMPEAKSRGFRIERDADGNMIGVAPNEDVQQGAPTASEQGPQQDSLSQLKNDVMGGM